MSVDPAIPEPNDDCSSAFPPATGGGGKAEERDPLEILEERLWQVMDLEERARRQLRLASAIQEVSHFTVWSGVAGFLPIPVLDLMTIIAVQSLLLRKLARIYGTTITRERAKATVGILASALLSTGAGTTVTASLSKLLPGWADYVGATITSCVAGSMTYALGRAFIVGFETDGAAMRFDADAVRTYFIRTFQAEQARRQAAWKTGGKRKEAGGETRSRRTGTG